ncbi:hypothetical protein V6N13_111754 [Hibiscus sabdariffa]
MLPVVKKSFIPSTIESLTRDDACMGESRNFSGHLLQSNSKRSPPPFYLFMDSKGSMQLPHEVSNFLQQQPQSVGDIKAAETHDSQIVIAE